MAIICDSCGREMNDQWEIEGMPGKGGNCAGCGDNLCAECGGNWSRGILCQYCAMSLEKLEFSLPMTVQRQEKKAIPCTDCKRDVKEAVTYEQRIYRHDDYFNGQKKHRCYEISYVANYSHKVLLCTSRHHTLRKALTEAHITLAQMGLNQKEEG